MERHYLLSMPPPRDPTPPTLPMGLQGTQQERRSATTVNIKPILTDRERANQIAQAVECLARRQRRRLSCTPIHSHIKMIKFESNKTANLDDKQAEAGVKKSVSAQVAAEDETDTKATPQFMPASTSSSRPPIVLTKMKGPTIPPPTDV